jgi:hypothetical protein
MTGGGHLMSKGVERKKRESRKGWLTTTGETAGIAWELVKKGLLVTLGLRLFGIITVKVVNECLFNGITLEPVVVKVAGGENAPAMEMAAQYIQSYIYKMIVRSSSVRW